MGLVIQQFHRPPLKNNNYLVADAETKEAVIIDCSCDDDEIINWAKEQGFTIKYILLTHGHFDHVLGVNHYHKTHGIDSYLHQADLSLLSRINEYTTWLKFPEVQIPEVKSFDSNTPFSVGKYPIEVIATPGHTVGGVCYLIDGNLFSGDTLFHGTCGRTDLKESDETAMQNSLALLFKKLPDKTPVYPGHGAPTTIGHERWLY